uniref:Uncharacterized protein n=1 Tax=Timspurckia oligopyrenoides TaxID=708627 RepID=A0A7S0ZCJ0_9RHOD|mmetsp:Transcript_12430/g.22456  ORF Transcript_12430/g.22456 Transcript_12430/m.22456 type:complete len:469 (+) Transcript_12430:131-1537(+)
MDLAFGFSVSSSVASQLQSKNLAVCNADQFTTVFAASRRHRSKDNKWLRNKQLVQLCYLSDASSDYTLSTQENSRSSGRFGDMVREFRALERDLKTVENEHSAIEFFVRLQNLSSSDCFNAVASSRALFLLSKFAQSNPSVYRSEAVQEYIQKSALVYTLCDIVESAWEELNDKCLASILRSLSILKVSEMDRFFVHWCRTAEAMMLQFGCRALVSCLNSFVELKFRPRQGFMEHWVEAFQMEVFQARAENLASILSAYANLRLIPSVRFLEAWYSGFAIESNRFHKKELVLAWNSFSSMNIIPRQAFFDALFSDLAVHRDTFSPCDLEVVLSGFQKLKMKVRPDHLLVWCDAFEASSQQFSGTQLCSIIETMDIVGVYPEDTFLSLWLSCLKDRAPELTSEALSTAMWSYAKLGQKPSQWSESLLKDDVHSGLNIGGQVTTSVKVLPPKRRSMHSVGRFIQTSFFDN